MSVELMKSEEFRALPEERQVQILVAENPTFADTYKQDPNHAIDIMRRFTGKPKAEGSPVGRAIRQFASGVGESVADTAAMPFEVAEWVASKAGSDWSTGVDEAIETWSKENYPDPVTPEGRVARRAGYWTGMGAQTFLGGAGAARTGLPVLAKAGKFLTSGTPSLKTGLGREVAAGAAGGLASGATEEVTDNPWVSIGAGILASGAVGISLAARGAAKRAREAGSGGQPPLQPGSGPLSQADEAAQDAFENLTTQAQRDHDIFGLGPEAQQEIMGEAVNINGAAVLEDAVDVVQKTFKPEFTRKITEAGTNILEAAGVKRPVGPNGKPLVTMTSQITDVLSEGLLSADQVDDLLRASGIQGLDELSAALTTTTSEAGVTLNLLSQASKRLGRALHPREGGAIRRYDPNYTGMGFWKRLDNVRRGFIVSQLATAMRNFETQTANMGVHTLENALEAGIGKLFPAAAARNPASPSKIFGGLVKLATSKKNRKIVDQMNDVLVDQQDDVLSPLYAKFSSDISTGVGDDTLAGLERMAQWVNGPNRFQEFTLRRAFFTDYLDNLLSKKGTNLARMQADNALDQIDRQDIKDAVGHALEMTWGKEFSVYEKGISGAEKVAGHAIGLINNAGWGPLQATQVIPFPRFMANAVRWQWQHSPHQYFKALLSPRGWDELRAGDFSRLSKATSGSGILWSAYQARSDPSIAGERWYEVRPNESVANFLGMERDEQTGNFPTVDIRPFNPFSSYMFAADLMHRASTGRLDELTTQDVAMGIMSVNLRAGAGLYVLDQFLDGFSAAASDIKDAEGTAELMKVLSGTAEGYVGTAWSGMAVPFQQLKDFALSFDKNVMDIGLDPTLRDTTDEPFAGPFKRRIPFADETMPEVELPTREAPPRTRSPALRQLTGVTVRDPKNPAEAEYDRLGFNRGEILPGSGDRSYDRIRAKHMGPLVERFISPLVQSQPYLQADDETKAIMLQQRTQYIRRFADLQARAEDPKKWYETREARRSRRMRRWMSSRKQRIAERSAEMERQRMAE